MLSFLWWATMITVPMIYFFIVFRLLRATWLMGRGGSLDGGLRNTIPLVGMCVMSFSVSFVNIPDDGSVTMRALQVLHLGGMMLFTLASFVYVAQCHRMGVYKKG